MSPSSGIAQLQSTFKVVLLRISRFPREEGEYVGTDVETYLKSDDLLDQSKGQHHCTRQHLYGGRRHHNFSDLHPLLFDEVSCDFCIIIADMCVHSYNSR